MPSSASPRLLRAACRCTCGAATPTGAPASAARFASTSSKAAPLHRLKPLQRWILPDFASRRRAVNLPAPRAQKFENRITLPDGSSSSIYTTSPRPNIAITKDTSNHPLWAFPSATGASGPVEDEGGRMGRFARRFANNQQQQPGSTEIAAQQQSTTSPVEATGTDGKKATSKEAVKQETTEKMEAAEPAPVKAEQAFADDTDLFDLSLEGEEAEVTGHKVVEESSKKGKKAGGKKK